MKQIKIKSLKSLFGTLILTGIISFHASAQQAAESTISSEVKVKQTTTGNALLDLSVSNKTAAPYLVVIRDENGNIIFREWAKGELYNKRFKLDILDSEKFSFEIVQNKKLMDSKQFKVSRRVEEKIEVYAVN